MSENDIISMTRWFNSKKKGDEKKGLTFLELQIEKEKNPEKYKPLETGFRGLDKWIGGFFPGTLNLICARPGTGKTVLTSNIIHNTSITNNLISLFFSTEMGFLQISSCLISISYGKNILDIRDRKTKEFSWEKFKNDGLARHFKNIYFEDESSHFDTELTRKIFTFFKEFPDCSAIYIDQLNKLKADVDRDLPEHKEIAITVQRLRNVARILDVPIILICQSNRRYDRMKDAPTQSDLSGSGALESEADTVIFLTREDKGAGRFPKLGLHVVKSRHGGQGEKIPLILDRRTLKITDV